MNFQAEKSAFLEEEIGMKKRICGLLVLGLLLFAVALADGYNAYDSGDYLGLRGSGVAIVVTKSVTIRTEPSFNGRKVESASNGDVLQVLGEDGNWVAVAYTKSNGNVYEGWVVRDYVVVEPMTITLAVSNVPAYCAPAKGAKMVGSLPKGTTLTVLGTWDDYYIVSLREASAFISMNVNHWTSTELYEKFYGSTVTASTLRRTRMYSGPGTDWSTLATIPAGVIVEVGDFVDGFVMIEYDGNVGFVEEENVQIIYGENDSVG